MIKAGDGPAHENELAVELRTGVEQMLYRLRGPRMARGAGVLCACLASLMLPFAPVEAVHKWIDEEGRVHYGNHAPPESGAEPVPLQPPPTEEDLRQARERSEGVQRRLDEIEKVRAFELASSRAQPRLARVPLVSESRFRCARGGLVSVGDAVESVLRDCGPPQSEHVVSRTDPGGVARLLVWRYAGYGKFARRLVIEAETVRRIEREAIRSPPDTNVEESWLGGRSEYYDDQREEHLQRPRERREEQQRRVRKHREQEEREEQDRPSYHRFGPDREEEEHEPEEQDRPSYNRFGP